MLFPVTLRGALSYGHSLLFRASFAAIFLKMRLWMIVLLLLTALLRAQDEDLPKHVQGESFDFEPKLMLDGPHAAPEAVGEPPSEGSAEQRVKQLEVALQRAEQRAADSEQLYKEGILARVEAEDRVLRVIRARKELADANLIVAAGHADAVKKSFDAHTAAKSDLSAANLALVTARETAATASSEWEKAQLEAAREDLKRKRKLYAEGVGSRREVEIAEDRLVLLSGTAAKEGRGP